MLEFEDFDLAPDVHPRNCQNYRTYVSVSTGEPILEVKNVLDMFHSLDYFDVISLGIFPRKFHFSVEHPNFLSAVMSSVLLFCNKSFLNKVQ